MESLLEFLRYRKEDRSVMADLRCALVYSKRSRVWPYLARFGGIGADFRAQAVQTIAGLYATHPSESHNESDDFGSLCRKFLSDDERNKIAMAEGVGPITRRFQHVLAADREEVFNRVTRFVLRAKAEDVPVNYGKLFDDLLAWETRADKVRTRWAQSFWAPMEVTEEAS